MESISSSGQRDRVGNRTKEPLRWVEAWQTRVNHHAPMIRFDRPLGTLPVSVTGKGCALRCAHCGGHYLQHMRSLDDVQRDGSRARSLLISGGCDSQGRVPVAEHLDTIVKLGEGRRLNWHVGMIDEPAIRLIAPHVDVVSFDVVGDRETAREVYGLDLDLDDYMRVLDRIRRHVPVVPHLTIGLRGGRISGEYAAIEALAERGVAALILIVLIPTEGTAFAGCSPPSEHDVAGVMIEARLRLPQARLTLGCMRPSGAYRRAIDVLAVRAGLNGIVNPTGLAKKEALRRGLSVEWGEECCALP